MASPARKAGVSDPPGAPAGRARPRSLAASRVLLVKRILFPLALVPAFILIVGALQTLGYLSTERWYPHGLSANPIDYITDFTGDWAIAFLVISLGVTPFRRLTGWNEVIKLRRMLGLFAFFYASLHLLTWVVLDKFFDFAWMADDIVERPFITVGMATFVILLALALTSTTGWIRRLGRRWQQLHYLVYVAALLAIVHFWWLVKADISEPRRYAVALAVMFAVRIWWTLRKRGFVPS
jgi:methionine sulfoxide reductase heme-binding subunit